MSQIMNIEQILNENSSLILSYCVHEVYVMYMNICSWSYLKTEICNKTYSLFTFKQQYKQIW